MESRNCREMFERFSRQIGDPYGLKTSPLTDGGRNCPPMFFIEVLDRKGQVFQGWTEVDEAGEDGEGYGVGDIGKDEG